MTDEHPAKDQDDPTASSTLIVGTVGTLLFIVVCIGVTIGFDNTLESEIERKTPHVVEEVADYRAEQAALLTSYDWVNQDEGIVTVPIERAIQLTSERLR